MDSFGNIKPTPSLTFCESISSIENLLETYEETSEEVNLALKDLSSFSPQVRIIPKGVWPNEPKSRICVQTHLKSTFADVVNLLKATCRDLSSSVEKYLHLLLTHSCGWSATYPSHLNDPWVKHFEERYPQLRGLVPILDSLTYVEELVEFPDEYFFERPWFILLATPDCYYIFDTIAIDDGSDGLRTAGETLEEVYTGLMTCRWAESSENPWDFAKEEACISADSFPYYRHKDNGNFEIQGIREEHRSVEIPGKGARPFVCGFGIFGTDQELLVHVVASNE